MFDVALDSKPLQQQLDFCGPRPRKIWSDTRCRLFRDARGPSARTHACVLTLAPNPRSSTTRITSRAPLTPFIPFPCSIADGALLPFPPPWNVTLARPVVTLTEHEVTPGRARTARSTWIYLSRRSCERVSTRRREEGERGRHSHVPGKRGTAVPRGNNNQKKMAGVRAKSPW